MILTFEDILPPEAVRDIMTLHRVEEVTRGERLAAVGWAQSMVRDARKREILYDLNVARLDFF